MTFFKNLSIVLISQIIVSLLGIVKSIILPKFWSIEAFGYWQLYLFYCGYVGLVTLGFNDGVYLRYGQYCYLDLPQRRIRGAVRLFIVMLLVFSVLTLIMTFFYNDAERRFIFQCVIVNFLLLCLNGFFVFIFQITNQIKKYSFFSIIDKLFLFFCIISVIIINNKNYHIVIFCDIIAKTLSVLAMILYCKELVFGRVAAFDSCKREFKSDILIGIKLLFANLMGMLILGIGRIFIEYGGNIQEYAYYAFGISVTNLVFILITAVSLVLYPTIKRIDKTKYIECYEKITISLNIFNYSVMLLYFPAYYLIIYYIPNYIPTLQFLNILFVLIILQSKSSLLHNTFFKVLRQEKSLLNLNIICIIIFCITTGIIYFFIRNLLVIAWSTLIIMSIRVFIADYHFHKTAGFFYGKNIVFYHALLLLVFFSFTSTSLPVYYGCCFYIITLFGYLFIQRSFLISIYKNHIAKRNL